LKIEKLIVHCSATREGQHITVDTIRDWHVNGRGWNDVGYHYIIYLNGAIVKGREDNVPGAHCRQHNRSSLGICYIGGVESERNSDGKYEAKDTRTCEQEEALENLLMTLKALHPKSIVHGHRDFANKACPSFDATKEYKYISEIDYEENSGMVRGECS
jgi:N-acetylmuramoyl-L-alanine amidase|tara:strand:- start:359 stop:835 length:477 start_codon:yes stop_codon:yes gene_type:complete